MKLIQELRSVSIFIFFTNYKSQILKNSLRGVRLYHILHIISFILTSLRFYKKQGLENYCIFKIINLHNFEFFKLFIKLKTKKKE